MATQTSRVPFTRQQIDHQINEDLEAGYVIPGILLAITVFGLISMIFSLWLAL